MITLRLSAADIDRFLADVPDVKIVFRHGCFVIDKKIGGIMVTIRAHPDLRDGRIRLAVPFDEIRGERVGGLAGNLAGMAWRWIESRLESLIAENLVVKGLPWDLVWVSQYQDPQRGGVGTINLSARMLNEWLRERPVAGPLALRLAAVEVANEAVTIEVALVDRDDSRR